MSTTDATAELERLAPAEIAATVGTIKKMLMIGAMFVVIGYLLLLFSLSQEFAPLSALFMEDSMKMWLKLGGVGHVLIGIFIALAGIIRALSVMPHRLAFELGRSDE